MINMGSKLQLCPHNILGKSKCKLCQKENHDNYRRKKGINVGVGAGQPFQLCPHGILGKSKCKKCRLERLHKWRLDSPDRDKELNKNYRIKHPDRIKKTQKNSYLKHSIKIGRRIGKFGKIPIPCKHSNKSKWYCKLCKREYSEERRRKKGAIKGGKSHGHKPIICEHNKYLSRCNICENKYRRNYYKLNRDKALEWGKKEYTIRKRNLGFNPLNDYFEGSNGHHINNEDVIYIPIWLHLSLMPHSLRTGLNMQLVNDCVFQYLECSEQVEWLNQNI